MKYQEPTVIKGGLASDDRGSVSFVNDFNFEGVKRFYALENYHRGFVRAWHGHKHEGKYIHCVQGSVVVGAVKIENWDQPDSKVVPFRTVLSAKNPGVLAIPAGYANGIMSLTDDAKVVIFSTSTLADSLNDDIRFPARLWDIWSVEER